MAFDQSDLAALEAAIKTGTKRVRYADREVEYHTPADMLALRDLMRTEIAAATGGSVVYAGRVD